MEQLVCWVRRHCRHFAREVRVDTAPIAALPQAPRVRTQRCLRQRSAWGRLNAPPALSEVEGVPVARADAGNEMPAIGRHRLRRERHQRVGLSVHLFGEANRLYMSTGNRLSEKVLTKSSSVAKRLNCSLQDETRMRPETSRLCEKC